MYIRYFSFHQSLHTFDNTSTHCMHDVCVYYTTSVISLPTPPPPPPPPPPPNHSRGIHLIPPLGHTHQLQHQTMASDISIIEITLLCQRMES